MAFELSQDLERGQTMYNGDTIDSANLKFANQVGQVRMFPDVTPSTKVLNSGLQVVCVLLRNKHSAALTPGQACLFSTTVTGETGAPVSALSQLFFIVDEYLPAAGVPVNDVFWGVVRGPTTANIVTNSGAKTAGQLAVESSTTAGKLDFSVLTPGNATVAQLAAFYGYLAFTEGAIADAATTARIFINRNFYGQ